MVLKKTKRIISKYLFTTILLICYSYIHAEILIGVIEQNENNPAKFSARSLFAQDSTKWIILNNKKDYSKYSKKEIDWTISFDGKKVGNFTSIDDLKLKHPECEWCFPRDKRIRIKNENDVPKLGNKEKRFKNWRILPDNRPIVIINKPYFNDKEVWKRFKPDKKHLIKLFSILRDTIGTLNICKGPPDYGYYKKEIESDDFKFYRSYKNNTNEMIISAGLLEKYNRHCDGPIDKESKPIWFYISDEIKLIGMEIDLLDIGDYDNDGKNEYVFHHAGYNEDGYILFENDFKDKYEYYWGYH